MKVFNRDYYTIEDVQEAMFDDFKRKVIHDNISEYGSKSELEDWLCERIEETLEEGEVEFDKSKYGDTDKEVAAVVAAKIVAGAVISEPEHWGSLIGFDTSMGNPYVSDNPSDYYIETYNPSGIDVDPFYKKAEYCGVELKIPSYFYEEATPAFKAEKSEAQKQHFEELVDKLSYIHEGDEYHTYSSFDEKASEVEKHVKRKDFEALQSESEGWLVIIEKATKKYEILTFKDVCISEDDHSASLSSSLAGGREAECELDEDLYESEGDIYDREYNYWHFEHDFDN